jgi:ABC-type transport system involved in multi-copper enzyme maturation permease subunit
MFFLLIRKELLEQLLSLRFAMACIICLVVVLSSTWVLTKDYKEALADYRTNIVLHKNEVEESNDLVFDGIKIDKPLNPMQIFFKGLDQELTATATVNSQNEPQFEANYEGNPVVFLFPPIDLLFFIGVVMSLLAIAFSYDAISGEKESGTLKLLMSYSVPRDLVLLAKWIGGYLALVAPFLVSVLCGLVVVVLFPTVELRAEHWGALGLIMLCALLYLAAIYSLGIFISARTQLASTSITVLLMVWVMVVLVVPNTAPYLAAQIHPVRDFVLVDKEKYQIEREENERFEKKWEEWQEKNEEAPNNIRRSTWPAMRRDQYLKLIDHQHKINDQFLKQLDGQIRLGQYLSRISPLSSFVYAASDLAGTGIKNRHRFLELLPEYRREITTFGFQTRIDANLNESDDRSIEGYPKFVFKESVLGDRIAWIDILFLGMWNILFFMGAYLSFLRYDVK